MEMNRRRIPPPPVALADLEELVAATVACDDLEVVVELPGGRVGGGHR
jgi:hypothetical protein